MKALAWCWLGMGCFFLVGYFWFSGLYLRLFDHLGIVRAVWLYSDLGDFGGRRLYLTRERVSPFGKFAYVYDQTHVGYVALQPDGKILNHYCSEWRHYRPRLSDNPANKEIAALERMLR